MADKQRDDILTLENLTEYLKIPKSTLYKLLQSGDLPGRKVGKQWRFHKRAIDTWLTSGNVVETEEKAGVTREATKDTKRK